MAAATGFSFGSAPQTGGLFGAKTTAATGSTFSFGAKTTAATGSTFSFGAKTTATIAPTLSFGTPSTGISGFGANKSSTATGFSFGATTTPAASSSSTTGLLGGGTSLFGSTAKTTSSGFSLFGAKTTTTTASTLNFGGFGGSTAGSTSGFSLTSSTATSTAAAKPVQNPKEEKVPAEITTLVTGLETFIKSQKDIKEEISKISSEPITKSREELSALKQGLALISNGLQRDSVSVENLKHEVGLELKNAEIAHRIKDVAVSLQHDFSAPMEYFSRLVYSFETRINCYRQEIEELEVFLSSSTPRNDFTPQDLFNVLRRVNESFVGLASELQQVNEAVKVIKEKYLHFRRVVYNDMSDPFAARKKLQEARGPSTYIGPSPFPVVQGAGIISSAFKTENKAPTIGFGNSVGSSFTKPAASGLTRSLSFGGIGKSTGGFGSSGTSFGTSLFGKSSLGTTASLNLATPASSSPFMLQKTPSGKRGKLF